MFLLKTISSRLLNHTPPVVAIAAVNYSTGTGTGTGHQYIIKENALTIFGLTFTFNGKNYDLKTTDIQASILIQIISDVLISYASINHKGFVSEKTEQSLICLAITNHLKTLGYKTKSVGNNNNTYQLWLNFLLINLLNLADNTLNKLKEECIFNCDDDEIIELICDLESSRLELTGRLDPSLRLQIQKRGLTVVQNTYMGFDTEYEFMGNNKNKLLSMQTAVQARTLIKVPLYNILDISFIHPHTSEITTFYKPTINSFYTDSTQECENQNINEMDLINESLKVVVKKMRCKNSGLYNFNDDIISNLKEVKGITYFEDKRKDQIVFALPLTTKNTKIIFPEEEVCFNDLVVLGNKQSDLPLRVDFIDIVKLIESVSGCNIPHLHEQCTKKHKPLRRTTITIQSGEKFSFSIVKNLFLCAHYNSADLCFLSDFSTHKGSLSIINKSFVTLGKPLKFSSTNVYIRDTILLAPAGKSSLSELGKLYTEDTGDFEKIAISSEDLVKMGEFLKRDPQGFENYAIQDAIITLKHAVSMEKFNFGIKQIGVPVTLASMGRNFVLDE